MAKKSFSELAPSTKKRYMRVLGVTDEKQAERILRKMDERGVTRKRLRGHAPKNTAKPAPKPVTNSWTRTRIEQLAAIVAANLVPNYKTRTRDRITTKMRKQFPRLKGKTLSKIYQAEDEELRDWASLQPGREIPEGYEELFSEFMYYDENLDDLVNVMWYH